MRNELKRHKRSDTVKWVIVFAAVLVLAAAVTAAVTAAITNGFTEWNPYGWFDSVKDGGETAVKALFKA